MTEMPVTDPNVTLTAESERYVSIPEWVLLHPMLSAPAVRLYGVLKHYARKSEQAWPGRAALGDHLGCSEDTVDRHLKQLRDVGAVEVIPRWEDMDPHTGRSTYSLERKAGSRQTSNIYRLRWNEPQNPPGAGRTAAAPPGRTAAAPGAARLRPEVHAVEAHASEVPEESARTTGTAALPPSLTSTSPSPRPSIYGPTEDELRADEEVTSAGPNAAGPLVSQLQALARGENLALALDRRALVNLVRPPLDNGTAPWAVRRAVLRLARNGVDLAPWKLQPELANVLADANRTGPRVEWS